MQATVFSGLTARDRGLGTGILAHEAVGSPGGSHLPPLVGDAYIPVYGTVAIRRHNIIVPECQSSQKRCDAQTYYILECCSSCCDALSCC